MPSARRFRYRFLNISWENTPRNVYDVVTIKIVAREYNLNKGFHISRRGSRTAIRMFKVRYLLEFGHVPKLEVGSIAYDRYTIKYDPNQDHYNARHWTIRVFRYSPKAKGKFYEK